MSNKRVIGDDVEVECVKYLMSQGIKNIEKNYRCRFGEIDIIGYDGEYLVFFEVKFRKNGTSGVAEAAVGYGKQLQICKVSDYYHMARHITDNTPMRYDVLAVNGKDMLWYKNAFDYIYTR